MAKELFESTSVPATLRYMCNNDQRQTGLIAPVTGAPMLKRLTPMAYNTTTNKFTPWVHGVIGDGLETIHTFIISGQEEAINHDCVQTSATEDTAGVMMLGGSLHVGDVALYGSNTLEQVKTAIRASKLSGTFVFQGMTNHAHLAK